MFQLLIQPFFFFAKNFFFQSSEINCRNKDHQWLINLFIVVFKSSLQNRENCFVCLFLWLECCYSSLSLLLFTLFYLNFSTRHKLYSREVTLAYRYIHNMGTSMWISMRSFTNNSIASSILNRWSILVVLYHIKITLNHYIFKNVIFCRLCRKNYFLFFF